MRKTPIIVRSSIGLSPAGLISRAGSFAAVTSWRKVGVMRKPTMLLIWMTAFPLTSTAADRPLVFTGICDASAAAAVNSDLFVVANDEDNLLRFYRLSRPGSPVHVYEVGPHARKKRKSPEMDIEGAARIGSRVFWISSHGRNADGEFAPNRHRLFALDVSDGGDA